MRVVDVQHRIVGRAELDALMMRRQEARAPDRRVLRHALRDARVHDDEVRQVAVVGAERVADPGAGRRPARELKARVQELRRRVVIDVLGVHALDEAELVGDRARVRQEVADPGAALAALLERAQRTDDRERGLAARHRRQALRLAHRGRQVLAVHALERRLVVERVDVRDRAEHVQADHAFGARRRSGPRPGCRRSSSRSAICACAPLPNSSSSDSAPRPPAEFSKNVAARAVDRAAMLGFSSWRVLSAPCRRRVSS